MMRKMVKLCATNPNATHASCSRPCFKFKKKEIVDILVYINNQTFHFL